MKQLQQQIEIVKKKLKILIEEDFNGTTGRNENDMY